LASTFTQFTDFFAELFGGLHDLLANIALPRYPQVVFVPGLDHERRNDGIRSPESGSFRQTDPHPAPGPERLRFFNCPVRIAASHSTDRPDRWR
jgi:hypothetical protein